MTKGLFYSIFIILLNLTGLYGQTVDFSYYDSLKIVLSNNSDICEVKIFKKYDKSGSIRRIELGVKYKSDSIDRYWHSGKGYSFYKNGRIKGRNNYHVETHVSCDSGIVRKKDGSLKYIRIFNNNYDSIFYLRSVLNTGGMICGYYPDSYVELWYFGEKQPYSITEYKFDFGYHSIKKHGIEKIYNRKDGYITLKKYNMGNLVEKENIPID